MSDLLIERAVGLADGFQLTQDGLYFSLPTGGFLPLVENCPQQYIDSLAGQLISQCLEQGRSFSILKPGVRLREDSYHDSQTLTISSSSDDWATNAIKAIVDSGVLE